MSYTNIISLNEGFELLEKFKKLSLEELKKINLNFFIYENGENLLFYTLNDLKLSQKLIDGGININHINKDDQNTACIASNFEQIEFLFNNGINLLLEKDNLLISLFENSSAENEKDESDFSKIQIFLISKNKNILIPPLSGFNTHYTETRILSLLTPETLTYLKNDLDIDFTKTINEEGENILFSLINSTIYSSNYGSFVMFEKILAMLTHEEINHLNYMGHNALWHISSDDEVKISLLNKYGLNFKQLDFQGKSVLEGHCKYFTPLVVEFIKNGAELSQQCFIDVVSLDEDYVKKSKKWNDKHYNTMLPLAKKQFSLYEQEKIKNEINIHHQENNKRSRL